MSIARGSVLVTGGAGFVGSWVLRTLLDRHDVERIVVVDNLFNGRREHVPDDPRIQLATIDLRDAQALGDLVADCRPTGVIHLAALHFIPYCDAHPAETLDVNVVGTQHLLEALRRHPPEALVAASSAAVYPINDGACQEDDPAGPTDIYGLSKWINEQQLELYARQTQTRVAAARLFNVFGPNETNPHVIPEIVRQLLEGATQIALGNVAPKRDYVFAGDVARALVAMMEHHASGFRTYNVGTGTEHSVEEIVRALAAISGRPMEITTDPLRVRRADRMHLLCDLTRIREELGWQPAYGLQSGLAALWASASGPSGPVSST